MGRILLFQKERTLDNLLVGSGLPFYDDVTLNSLDFYSLQIIVERHCLGSDYALMRRRD